MGCQLEVRSLALPLPRPVVDAFFPQVFRANSVFILVSHFASRSVTLSVTLNDQTLLYQPASLNTPSSLPHSHLPLTPNNPGNLPNAALTAPPSCSTSAKLELSSSFAAVPSSSPPRPCFPSSSQSEKAGERKGLGLRGVRMGEREREGEEGGDAR